jgi:hypothetical protein
MVQHDYKTVLMHFARKRDMVNLWNYTTGLRGNDDSDKNQEFKEIITTVIRGNVFEAFGFGHFYAMVRLDQCVHYPKESRAMLMRVLGETHGHARLHAVMALRSLAVYYENRGKKDDATFAATLYLFAEAISHKDEEMVMKYFISLHKQWG